MVSPVLGQPNSSFSFSSLDFFRNSRYSWALFISYLHIQIDFMLTSNFHFLSLGTALSPNQAGALLRYGNNIQNLPTRPLSASCPTQAHLSCQPSSLITNVVMYLSPSHLF